MGALSSRSTIALSALVVVVAVCVGACSEQPPAPASPTSAPVLDNATRAAVDDRLAEIAQSIGLVDPPEIEPIRIVSTTDWPTTQVDCLSQAGFDVALTADATGIESDVAESQQDAFRLATYTCAAKYPIDPAQDESRLSDEQKLVAYDYLTVTLVECLSKEGFAVTDIPTPETFLATWDSARWNPYFQLTGATEELMTTCLPNPPAALLWGS